MYVTHIAVKSLTVQHKSFDWATCAPVGWT